MNKSEKKDLSTCLPLRDKSEPYGNDQAILQAFKQDGYCVVTGILSEAEIDVVMDELWTSDRLLGKFDHHDRTTWGDPSWPQQPKGGRNFLQSTNVYQDACSWDIASNERLVHVQQLLYGRTDLMACDVGRFGVMRPSKNNPEWQTESSWLHWDQNPNTQPGFYRVQCIVCLTDSTVTSGGFVCVPGFHRQFRAWGEQHPVGSVVVDGKVINETFGTGQPFPVPQDDPCQKQAVRVIAPAGAAVLWDSRLPHQNFPNTDVSAFRVVHYTNMKIRDDESVKERRRLLHQKRVIMDLLGEEGMRFPHHLSTTGRYVYCLEEEPLSLEEILRHFGVEDNVDSLREAAKLVREAGKSEERGDMAAAIKKHQSSLRLFPAIEEWHEAIFG